MTSYTITPSGWNREPESSPFIGEDLSFLQHLCNDVEAGEEFTPDVFAKMVAECETGTVAGHVARLAGVRRKSFYSAARDSGMAQWEEACKSFFRTIPESAADPLLPLVPKDLLDSIRENPLDDCRDRAEVWGILTRDFLQQRHELVRVIDEVGGYHLVDDVGASLFAFAVATSSHLEGPPLWGMILGPPSGGKTEDLDLIDTAVDHHLDDMTAPGLLSWHKSEDGESEPGGALIRIGKRGLITIADFSTVLSDSQRGRRDALFSMLRRIYDGSFQRDLGNEDEPLYWSGRITFLAACTGAIDNYASHSDALGPRWVYLRRSPRDRATRRAVTSRSLAVATADQHAKKTQAQHMAGELIQRAGALASQVRLTAEAMRQVADAALVVCYGRASVPRDSYGQREIVGMPSRAGLPSTPCQRCEPGFLKLSSVLQGCSPPLMSRRSFHMRGRRRIVF